MTGGWAIVLEDWEFDYKYRISNSTEDWKIYWKIGNFDGGLVILLEDWEFFWSIGNLTGGLEI